MIGPDAPRDPGWDERAGSETSEAVTGPSRDAAVRWGIGCLVGAVALAGVLSLAALLAFYLQPPAWVQVVLGVVLALGAVLLAWLVAAALGRAAERDLRRRTGDEERAEDLPRPGGSLTR